MSDRQKIILAWVLCALSIIGGLSAAMIRLSHSAARPTFDGLVEAFGWGVVLPLVFSILAGVILTRQPGNRVGWMMMLIALAIVNPLPIFNEFILTPPKTVTPGLWLLLWLDNWSWIPVIFLTFLIPLHFPTGHPPAPRWNWVNRLAIGMWLFFITFNAFATEVIGPLNADWTVPNPVGFIPFDLWGGPFDIVWGIGLLSMVFASVTSLFVRYRHAQVNERQQIKWLLYAGAIFVILYTATFFLSDNEAVAESGLLNQMLVLGILALPIAIAVAILRYRLYDIDLLIRRTLQYTVLTGLLALVYYTSLVVLQGVIDTLTGEQPQVVIVFSTLAIAALFNPLRLRLQDFIDRRFYRNKISAELALVRFSASARDEVDMDRLTSTLLNIVEETMRPEKLSVWIKKDH